MKNRFENFTALINKISRNIRRIKTEEMKKYDLKSPHVSCIYYLHKHSHLTATYLTDLCAEDKAAISRSLEYLESNGFIIYEDKDKKRYNSNIYLTEKGKNVGVALAKKIDSVLEEASKGMNEEERVILYQCLSLISNNLENIVEQK